MSNAGVGRVEWMDLTVANADEVRDFYKQVVGWQVSEVDMGGYSDYCMMTPDGTDAVSGVCHARGVNAEIPPLWLIYINVSDMEKSIEQVKALGGKLRSSIKTSPQGSFCLIEDPAGAVAALYQAAATPEETAAND